MNMQHATFAQKSILSSVKASCGVMIMFYYLIFLGTAFWSTLFLFFIQDYRTDKPHDLLRHEAAVWFIMGGVALYFGIVGTCIILKVTRTNFTIEDQAKMFGPVHPPKKDTKKNADVENVLINVDDKDQQEEMSRIHLSTEIGRAHV